MVLRAELQTLGSKLADLTSLASDDEFVGKWLKRMSETRPHLLELEEEKSMKRKMAVRTEDDEQTMKRELWSFLSMEGGGGPCWGGGVKECHLFFP